MGYKRLDKQDSEWFLNKVNKSNKCWLWSGATFETGYGYITIRESRKKILAHRFSYETFVGPIPDGLFICHKCDVRICVRPDHLFAGTHKDNMVDMDRKGRRNNWNNHKTRCPKGHSYSGDNLYKWKNKRMCKQCQKQAYKRWLDKRSDKRLISINRD